MSETGINLLPEKKGEVRLSGKVFYSTLGIFVVTFIIAFILVAFSLVLHSQVNALVAQEGKLRSELFQDPRREKLLIVKERVHAIKNVLSSRKKVTDRVSFILSSLPETLGIQNLTADDNAIGLSMASPSLAKFEEFFSDIIPNKVGKEKIMGVTLVEVGSFVQTADSYALDINFTTKNNE